MSCIGEVKSFNNAKSWGFVTCEGVDVFLHVTDCTDGKPVPGDVVTFDIEEDAKREGHKKALNVRGCSGAAIGPPVQKAKPAMVEATGSCEGTVKSFNHVKGWGFIVHMEQDIYVHVKDCKGGHPEKGDILTFDLLEDKVRGPGMMKAINVTGGTGWSLAGPGSCPKGGKEGAGKGGKGVGMGFGYEGAGKGKIASGFGYEAAGKGGKSVGIGFGYAGDWMKGKGKGEWGPAPAWGKGEWGPEWGKGKGEWGPAWGKGDWGPASWYGSGPYGKASGGDGGKGGGCSPYGKVGGGDVGKGGGAKNNSQEMKAGDWFCPACGNMVFASKNQCKLCGQPKPELGW